MGNGFRKSELRKSFGEKTPRGRYYEHRNIYQGPREPEGIFGFDELHHMSYDARGDQEFLEDNNPAIDP